VDSRCLLRKNHGELVNQSGNSDASHAADVARRSHANIHAVIVERPGGFNNRHHGGRALKRWGLQSWVQEIVSEADYLLND